MQHMALCMQNGGRAGHIQQTPPLSSYAFTGKNPHCTAPLSATLEIFCIGMRRGFLHPFPYKFSGPNCAWN